MSGFQELRDMGVVFRPFDGTPPPSVGTWSRFDASWADTIALLARELRHLDARNIIVELALTEADLRVDGLPRANARLASESVRVSFDSKWGPLRYETGEFSGRWGVPGWQANVRAVALAMEALRKVDRYGVSKRGEQYTGWKALPPSTDAANAIQTREQAVAVLEQYRVGPDESLLDIARRAQRKSHPDAGGDPDEFRKVTRAKELIG